MRKPNTERMLATLEFIKEYKRNLDRMPSFRLMKSELHYSSMNTLVADIDRLVEQNALIKDKDGRLNLPKNEVCRKRSATLVGGIRCGAPTDATEEEPETVELPVALFGEDVNRVIMKAEGDSMIGLGIHDGDWLIVKKQPTANEGETIAAMLAGGEFTCKILRQDEDGYYLEAANPDYGPIRPTDDWFIYGVVQQVVHKI